MPRATTEITIGELERMLATRKKRLAELMRKRAPIQSRLDRIDAQIAQINGNASRGAAATGGNRSRNAMSLVATITQVLKKSRKPMSVGDILEEVLRTGYRSSSGSFRSLLNQTLVKEKQFASAGRGIYKLSR